MNIIQEGQEPQDDCKFTLNIAEKSVLRHKLLSIVYDSWQDNLKHKDMKILICLLNDENIFSCEKLIYSQDIFTRIQELLAT